MIKYSYYLKDVTIGFIIDVIREMKNSKIGKCTVILNFILMKVLGIKKILSYYYYEPDEYIALTPKEIPDYVENLLYKIGVEKEGVIELVEKLYNIENDQTGYTIICKGNIEKIVFTVTYGHNGSMSSESVLFTAFSKNVRGEFLVTNGKRRIFPIKINRKIVYCGEKKLNKFLKKHIRNYQKEEITEIDTNMVLNELHSFSKKMTEALLIKGFIFK